MNSTVTRHRLGTLQVERFGSAAGGYRPTGVTLKNDGFWDGPGWLTRGRRYRLDHDGRAWVATCQQWQALVKEHTWRLADEKGNLLEFLPLLSASLGLDPSATYEIAEDEGGQWSLYRGAHEEGPALP